MGKLKSHKVFEKEALEILSAEYIILGKYINQRTKIKIKHNTCGHEYETLPTVILQGGRCPKCFGNEAKRKSTNRFKEEVKSIVGDEYEVLGDYINTHTKILIKHNKCGNEYEVRPSSFLSGTRCPNCNIKKHSDKRRKSPEQFEKEVYDLVGDEYTLMSSYIDSKSKVLIKHNICGYEYMIKPGNFINLGRRCPICAKKSYGAYKKLSKGEFINRILQATGNEYTLIGNYVDTTTKVLMKHNKCGNEWEITPKNFLKGRRCPLCNISNGESTILQIFDKHNINYQREKEFDGLIGLGGNPLRVDYAVYKDNDLFLLIEYQGEFHDGSISNHYQTRERLEKQQEHDRRKREYAKEHNIKLLEIWYWDFDNIEKILAKYLKGLS
ncbi:hypothetical protein EXM89_12090 [Clostridium botulinum]|nr:hypothetical protein [Clostridium botulinum]NFB60716.1 hypothetical protein [Clostridium botulinum]